MTLIHGYLSESTQLEFSNEYQYDRFSMVFKSRRPGALDESSFSIERVNTGELGYDRLLNDGLLYMTEDMLGPNPMHIKYSSYVYDGFCI